MPPSKKNILFYIGALEAGGAERVLIDLLTHLNRDKYNLSLAVNRQEGFFFDKIPAHVKLINRAKTPQAFFGLKERIFGLPKIIKEQQADLVIAIMPSAGRSLLRRRLFVNSRVKMMVRIGQNPTKKLQENTSWFWNRVEFLEIKYFFPKADAILAISEGVKENLLNQFLFKSNNVKVIYNPIDRNKITLKKQEPVSLPFSFSDNHSMIAAVGRLVSQKGYDDMLRVFREVRKEIPAKLLILGKGPLESHLRLTARKLGIENDVYMAGFVENPWAYLNNADIYLSTSLYEGFHLSIVEAMACGVVPVATDCNYGPREIITDGEDGRLAPVGDTKAITEAVVDLLKNSQKRQKMAQSALLRAKDFDLTVIIKQYEDLFDTVLDEQN